MYVYTYILLFSFQLSLFFIIPAEAKNMEFTHLRLNLR